MLFIATPDNSEIGIDVDTSINGKAIGKFELIKDDTWMDESKTSKGKYEEDMKNETMLSVFDILQAQTACTEIRGGQAGMYNKY